MLSNHRHERRPQLQQSGKRSAARTGTRKNLLVDADPARDELRVILADAPQLREWRGDLRSKVAVSRTGQVVGVMIRGYRKRRPAQADLVNLIVNALGADRSDVIEALGSSLTTICSPRGKAGVVPSRSGRAIDSQLENRSR